MGAVLLIPDREELVQALLGGETEKEGGGIGRGVDDGHEGGRAENIKHATVGVEVGLDGRGRGGIHISQ